MERCNKPATYYAPKGGFRACIEHATPGLWHVGTWGIGLCDQPLETHRDMFKRTYASSRSQFDSSPTYRAGMRDAGRGAMLS